MRFPETLKYTKDHEWVKTEGKEWVVGITDHAQSALGDVVYIELPDVGRELKAGESFGVVESIKAVSDLYAPLSGKVTARNSEVLDNPAHVNEDPHEKAWMIKLVPNDPAAASKDLMDAATYTKYVAQLK